MIKERISLSGDLKDMKVMEIRRGECYEENDF